jgi:plastocyanin
MREVARANTLRRNAYEEATMKRKKRIRLGALALTVALLGASSAYAQSSHAGLTIRHQLRGCHSWSFNNGPYKPSLKIKVAAGTTLTVTDNDMMPHRLIQLAGPKLHLVSPAMNHMGATAKVTFLKKGIYRFGTKPGEDYMKGIKTIGPDNVLRLTVTVS